MSQFLSIPLSLSMVVSAVTMQATVEVEETVCISGSPNLLPILGGVQGRTG